MYGDTDRANSVALENASPDRIFRYVNTEPLAYMSAAAKISWSINGTGIEVPRR